MFDRFRYWTILGLALALPQAAFAVEPAPIVMKAETALYRFELDIGGMERMYTRAEAVKLHPKDGEIMVSGAMAGMSMANAKSMAPMTNAQSGMSMNKMPMPAMAAEPGWRHLEVHVISKASGKPIRGAKVRIVVTNAETKRWTAVPIAVMYGVREGVADWHYGNNVMLPAGSYRIEVAANGEKTVFELAIPASNPS